ncbi:MAG: hypothetical protein ACKO1H_10325 [Tabrizicola sp.]
MDAISSVQSVAGHVLAELSRYSKDADLSHGITRYGEPDVQRPA